VRIVAAAFREIRKVAARRQGDFWERRHQATGHEIVSDQRRRPHRYAKTVERGLNCQVEMIEGQ
jgi:hypothetical protein